MEAVFKNWIHGLKFVSSVTDHNATPYRFTEQFFSRLTKLNLHLEQDFVAFGIFVLENST